MSDFHEQAIRDPIHKWIKFSTPEKELIDSPLVQRLRHVSQLTSADLVFPGGTHNRFTHSVGAMHLAGKYMKNLFRSLDDQMGQNPELKANTYLTGILEKATLYVQMARITALLHDIGHGPFSHAYDRAIYKQIYPGMDDGGHDLHRLTIIKSPLLAPYVEGCGVSPEDIIKCWTSRGDGTIYGIIHAIVQGPLGADRMDFTLRDSCFTGTEHLGTISPQRIISNSMILIRNSPPLLDVDLSTTGSTPEVERPKIYLAYRIKALSDIIQALNGRFQMYECVYLHKTSYAANILVENMIEASTNGLNLIERTQDLDQFVFVNDYTIVGEIMSSRSDEMASARDFCKRLLLRKLPKMKKEIMVSAKKPFRPHEYSRQNSKDIVVRTRNIGGIDAKAFDKEGIYFVDKKQHVYTCQESLDGIRYVPSQEPFYFVRIYEL
jgi:hypothetical protein